MITVSNHGNRLALLQGDVVLWHDLQGDVVLWHDLLDGFHHVVVFWRGYYGVPRLSEGETVLVLPLTLHVNLRALVCAEPLPSIPPDPARVDEWRAVALALLEKHGESARLDPRSASWRGD